MIGVVARFECPSCGNLIKHKDTVKQQKGRHYFEEPRRCGCGRKSGFALVDFKSAEVQILEENNGGEENGS